MSTPINYRADIDGLRGIAVLAIVLYHSGTFQIRGGFTGVDVFFVISGFLITSILDRELTRGTFSLAGFYERRARRIIPALIATLCLAWLVSFAVLLPHDFKAFSGSLAGAVTFTSNMVFWRDTGYFAAPADTKPLLHTWSLAIEEQFYVLFPLVLVAVHRRGRRATQVVIGLIALCSFSLSLWATYHAPKAAFYLAPMRAWELMLGSLVALEAFPAPARQSTADCLTALGLGLVLCGLFVVSPTSAFPGVVATLPCVGAALIVHGGLRARTAVGALLSWRPLVFIGLISYSLYLLHWPVLVLARYYAIWPLREYQGALLLAGAGGLAVVSWRWIERPFRQPQRSVSYTRLTVAAGAAVVLLLGVAGEGYVTDGFAARYPDYAHRGDTDRVAADNDRRCFLVNQPFADWQGTDCFLSRRGKSVTLLWGDSFSAHLVPGIVNNLGSIDDDILQYSVASCAPILDQENSQHMECRALAEQALTIIKTYAVSKVILACRWELERERYPSFLEGIRRTIAVLQSMGTHVIVVGQTPTFTFSDTRDLEYRMRHRHLSTTTAYAFLAFEPSLFRLQ